MNTTLYTGNQQGLCQSYFNLEYVFNGVEVMEIFDFAGDDFYNTSIIAKIIEIERKDGKPFAQTFLPFAGDDAYYHSFEYTTIAESEINLIMKGFTGTVGLGLIYLAVANTRFYNPIFGYLKEALKQENTVGKIGGSPR